ncbi:MAG TPA: L-histidine N(alpha)-methyltransferase [Verrucomicrobiae bacterium]|jgi:uncharacterized SAM-dependent methyltransferase
MPSTLSVAVHPSQFPEIVQRELIDGLRQRRVSPKFHYQSYKQSQKWLAVHEAWSPARNDADCAAIYKHGFSAACKLISGRRVVVIGLGCGGGQKEAQLLTLLSEQGKEPSFIPCDVSLPLVLTASEAGQRAVKGLHLNPLLCDLTAADDLRFVFDDFGNASVPRIITFFGMIPNMEPDDALSRLATLVRPGDVLLVSANLAPGPNYAAGVNKILPGYDNAETREWLLTFLIDIGIGREDGTLQIKIEDAEELKRIVADFQFSGSVVATVQGERVEFPAGEQLRLFFSYRYTPEIVERLLKLHKLKLAEKWITKSEEEGVFLVIVD